MGFPGNSLAALFRSLRQPAATYHNQIFVKILLDAISQERKLLVFYLPVDKLMV